MKKFKSVAAMLLAVAMTASLAACDKNNGGNDTTTAGGGDAGTTAAATPSGGGNEGGGNEAGGGNEGGGDTEKVYSGDEIKEFTSFMAVPGSELNPGNRVQEIIASKIGARCKETWLVGQTAEEATGMFVASGEYPDFFDASAGMSVMIDAGAFIPIDEYWDNYPNLKAFWSEANWNKVKNFQGGHVYVIPQFGNVWEYDTSPSHNDEAWWIQTRVLKWAGYPVVESMDEYFDLIERYIAANPTMEDGTPNIGYEILCEDWRYFCLENAPFFLDGYPNDGCVIVPLDTQQAVDYNTTPTAKRYFQKLNEMYQKGIVDPEFATMNYDSYINKISSGRVCGMVDQYWDFGYTGEAAINNGALSNPELKGCTYIPLGITIEKGMTERYHSKAAIDVSNGIGITTSCQDIEGALQFMDDLLRGDILTLRNWGEEGVDYLVGDDGLFYRTQEMRDKGSDADYRASNACSYSYFPNYGGMDHDGINAANPSGNGAEFYEGLSDEVKECFDAYGVKTYVEFLDKQTVDNTAWYPMWSYSNALTRETADGEAWANMADVKHEFLPKVVMDPDFDGAWNTYMDAYNSRCNVQDFLDGINAEIQRRIAEAS